MTQIEKSYQSEAVVVQDFHIGINFGDDSLSNVKSLKV